MRARWRLLFWISLGALIGLAWVAQTFHAPLWGFVNVPFLGMVAAAAVAFYAMVTATAEKWPALVVLVCAVPMALDLFRALSAWAYFIGTVGIPAALFLAGSSGTIGVAVYILVVPPAKPPPEEPIARAQVR